MMGQAAETAAVETPTSARCPLCDGAEHRGSWVGTVNYRGREFEYRECPNCYSLFCHPMPDAVLLQEMYGAEYGKAWQEAEAIADPRDPLRVCEWLNRLPTGVFVDYGCGGGELLLEARRHGWVAMGVELNERVVRETAARTGCRVVASVEAASLERVADVLHLGDVVEHLTDVNCQMQSILALLKPGGVLLAQGPLEANANLFTWAVRLARWLRGRSTRSEPPYHVMLATLDGQETFFRRFGLSKIAMSVSETTWPAPYRLSMKELNARRLGLYVLRRVSRRLSRIRPGRWGNRYFYVGRMEANPTRPMRRMARFAGEEENVR